MNQGLHFKSNWWKKHPHVSFLVVGKAEKCPKKIEGALHSFSTLRVMWLYVASTFMLTSLWQAASKISPRTPTCWCSWLCVILSSWVWAGPSDSLPMNKISSSGWMSLRRLGYTKAPTSSWPLSALFLWAKPAALWHKLPEGETQATRHWRVPANSQEETEASSPMTHEKLLISTTTTWVSLEVNLSPAEPWEDCGPNAMTAPPS